MNTFEHTPGPWELRGSRLVTDCHGVVITENVSANHPGTPEGNARLIAAAPDLLAALEEFLPYAEVECQSLWDLKDDDGDRVAAELQERIEKAVAVIARTRGNAQ